MRERRQAARADTRGSRPRRSRGGRSGIEARVTILNEVGASGHAQAPRRARGRMGFEPTVASTGPRRVRHAPDANGHGLPLPEGRIRSRASRRLRTHGALADRDPFGERWEGRGPSRPDWKGGDPHGEGRRARRRGPRVYVGPRPSPGGQGGPLIKLHSPGLSGPSAEIVAVFRRPDSLEEVGKLP